MEQNALTTGKRKREIVEGFEQLLEERRGQPSATVTREEAAEKARDRQMVEAASTYTVERVVKGLADLQLHFGGDVGELGTKLGAEVIFVAPPTLLPSDVRRLPVQVSYDLDDVVERVDVINMLRIQFERLGGNPFPSIREYSHYFGLTVDRMKLTKSNILVMHPGPINRGLEMESEVADGRNSVILEQVTNGLAVRMAVLFLVNQAANA